MKRTWEPDGWHGFDFTDAAVIDADQVQRDIAMVAGFDGKDLRRGVYILAGEPPRVTCVNGGATFIASGDTLVFKVIHGDGYESVYDCRVRRMYHPRVEGCAAAEEA